MEEQNDELLYIHLPSGSDLPELEAEPCRVIVIVEQTVTLDWQVQVSEWIIAIGCLYMMAWGLECSSWDDSVDWANIEAHDSEEIPDDDFVMTTWHDNEPLDEAFVFCRLCASHPTIELPRVIILDITAEARSAELIDRYWHALDDLQDEPQPTLLSRLTEWFNRTIKRT